jgi:alkylhydroperoxidase family enzyme
MAWIGEAPVDASAEPWFRSNIMRSMSLNPQAMRGVAELSRGCLFGGSRLTRAQEEMVVTTVASLNGCFY